ncbi:MAG: hypothetical protein MRY59_05675, partial [Aquisalinus sp.]|nr:hypothetical protein [Aquisalinus sp.]
MANVPEADKNEATASGVTAASGVGTGSVATGVETIIIEKPPAGLKATYRLQGKQAVFEFNLQDADIELVDVDIVLTFADGAQIVLLEAGLEIALDETIQMQFADQLVSGQEMLSRVGEINVEDVSEVNLTSMDKDGGDDQTPEPKQIVKVVQQEIQVEVEVEVEPPQAAQLDLVDTEVGSTDNEEDRSRIEENLSNFTGRYNSPEDSSAAATSTDEESETSVFDLGVSDITVELFGITRQSATGQITGGAEVRGGTAEEPADEDSSFAAQFRTELITGTDQDDIIFADNPDIAPSNTSARVFEVTVDIPFEGFTPTGATISGLPQGWVILNAENNGGTYRLEVDEDNPNLLVLEIRYVLEDPTSEPDENGYFGSSTLTIQYDVISDSGQLGTTTATTQIVQAVVESDEDQTATDPITGDQIVVLAVNPPGNDISAGDGDDIIFAGVGADRIDGGGGTDFVSYEISNRAVFINLSTGEAEGGYAEGDQLISIEGVGGSSFNDVLIGSNADNLFEGGAGADLIDGLGGIDTASYASSDEAVLIDLEQGIFFGGHAADDRLVNIENITGSAFDDTLIGDAGDNELSGLAGDDLLVGGFGADLLNGGDGFDTADYTASNGAITIDLLNDIGVGAAAEGDILRSIEQIEGSAFDDQISGDDNDNVFSGNGGDDTLRGRGGNDTLIGGDGDDTLLGGEGDDLLQGGAGSDTADYSDALGGVTASLLTGTATAGATNNDILEGIENLTGSDFADRLTGSDVSNVLRGGGGNDTLIGGAGADTLDGGAGNDLADYLTSSDAVFINLAAGTASGGDADGDILISIESLSGSNFSDILIGNAEDNNLFGNDGNDILIGGAGADFLDGGDGIDTIDYTSSLNGILVNLNLNLGTGGDAEGDTYASIENVIGTDFNDIITGNDSSNTLEGRGGDDILSGGIGADILLGGTGFDIADYSGSTSSVFVNLASGLGAGGDANGDLLVDIEGLSGSSFDDVLTGNEADNELLGAAGDDELDGAGGDDILDGGLGDDLLRGGAGADALDGGSGTDTVDYSGSAVGVTVNLETGTGSGGEAQGDTLQNIENVIGTAASDSLTGSDQSNELIGGSGNDVLAGLEGADILDGGAGQDVADYSSSAEGVTVDLNSGAGIGGDASGDTLISIENVTGSNQDDVLIGNIGANTLIGNAGNDQLSGGLASDQLIGGTGNDTLIGGEGGDLIDGGAGQDTASYVGSISAVFVNLAAGTANGGDADGDVLISIENLSGSALDDELIGDGQANILEGRGGDDTLSGGGGVDTLLGGAGDDVLEGGLGGDVLDG